MPKNKGACPAIFLLFSLKARAKGGDRDTAFERPVGIRIRTVCVRLAVEDSRNIN